MLLKKDGVSRQEVAKGVAQQYRRPSFNISIRDLLKNINPKQKFGGYFLTKKDGVSRQEVAKGVAQQYRRPSFTLYYTSNTKKVNKIAVNKNRRSPGTRECQKWCYPKFSSVCYKHM